MHVPDVHVDQNTDKKVSTPKNRVNMQNMSCADVDGTHDTSMQGSIPAENGSNTNETMYVPFGPSSPAENQVCEKGTPEISHDTSYLLKNSDTLSSTQEKSPDSCGTDENSNNLVHSQHQWIPQFHLKMLIVHLLLTQSDEEMLSLLIKKGA